MVKIKAVQTLPENYKEIFSIDLQRDKKTSVLVNVWGAVVVVAMIVAMNFAVPIDTLFDMSNGISSVCIKFAVMIVSTVAYVILHELVHGITMKICGTKKVKYGFKGVYAYAGSDDYYDKRSYIAIALAPVVLWGVVLAIINVFVPVEWFWVAYFVQVMNISGAIGDFYVTFKFSRLPKDILVKDYGVGMKVYSAE